MVSFPSGSVAHPQDTNTLLYSSDQLLFPHPPEGVPPLADTKRFTKPQIHKSINLRVDVSLRVLKTHLLPLELCEIDRKLHRE